VAINEKDQNRQRRTIMGKQGFKVADLDLHVYEPDDLWIRYLEPAFKDRAPRPADGVEGAVRFIVDEKPLPAYSDHPERLRANRARSVRARAQTRYGEARAEGFSPRTTLKAMDAEGVDVAILYRTFGAHVIAFDGMDPGLSAAFCRATNNWLRDYCDADPDRLKLSALLPQHDVGKAVEEARRSVKELGAVALVITPNPVNGRGLYDPEYDQLWKTAVDLNVPVTFHGIHAAYQEHVTNRFLNNLAMAHTASHPIEAMLAVGSVLYGGMLEKYPALKMAFLECNAGWLPWWLHRLDEEWEKFGPGELVKLTLKPSEYFLRQCYISADPGEPYLKHVVEALGDNNIGTSTDFPHDDAAYPNSIDNFLALPGLGEETRRKILWDNPARLYNLSWGRG
jgi:predicted TIM-barrel fold metal-dependent hydrolase